uniref:Uncharacterized protein n=1 Tax=Candidatus Kentrum sp. FM TaxID=2126340 RepID=A0A450X5I2_9GAMM|nr:MAG: hypothetical protein BECKFM1743B_GA0114221_110042 [Candidatus Kentron sp. FM]
MVLNSCQLQLQRGSAVQLHSKSGMQLKLDDFLS